MRSSFIVRWVFACLMCCFALNVYATERDNGKFLPDTKNAGIQNLYIGIEPAKLQFPLMFAKYPGETLTSVGFAFAGELGYNWSGWLIGAHSSYFRYIKSPNSDTLVNKFNMINAGVKLSRVISKSTVPSFPKWLELVPATGVGVALIESNHFPTPANKKENLSRTIHFGESLAVYWHLSFNVAFHLGTDFIIPYAGVDYNLFGDKSGIGAAGSATIGLRCYPFSGIKKGPSKEELARQAEEKAREAELKRQAEEKARLEKELADKEAAHKAEMERQAEAVRQAELARQEALAKLKEANAEERAKLEAELAKQEELARQAEEARLAAEKQAEIERQEALAKIEAARLEAERQEELARQAELKRQAEEKARLERELAEKEAAHKAELARQEELRKQAEEKARLEAELAAKAKLPPELDAYVENDEFTPDGDGEDDEAVIFVAAENFSKENTKWEIVIRDEKNQLFKKIKGDGILPERIVWDGLSDTGERVSSANTYSAELTVRPAKGKRMQAKFNIDVGILVEQLENGALKMIVNSILFDSDAATFKKLTEQQRLRNRNTLNNVARQILKYADYNIVIQGHANNISGTERENVEELIPLSQKRAESIMQELYERGIPKARMTAVGVGGKYPLVSRKNKAEWWKNRRVEFILEK